jgi:hypothetical protein
MSVPLPEGAEVFHLNFSREDDDYLDVPDMGRVQALRISIGGHPDVGYYCKFRGDPEDVVKILEVIFEAAKQQLPRGRYDDMRSST